MSKIPLEKDKLQIGDIYVYRFAGDYHLSGRIIKITDSYFSYESAWGSGYYNFRDPFSGIILRRNNTTLELIAGDLDEVFKSST